MKNFDIAIIGGGPGGYVAAIKAAQMGASTVLFEKNKVGGICLNEGCIPTKTMLRTAKLYDELLHASAFGIDIEETSTVKINWENLLKRKEKVVKQLVDGVSALLKHNGVKVVKAYAEVLEPGKIRAQNESYTYKHLIIATGSRTFFPDIPGLKESYEEGHIIDSTGAIQLKEKPERMVILGGGVIAVEFATLFNALGTQVVMLQRSHEILTFLDHEVRSAVQKHLLSKGVDIHLNTQVSRIDGDKVYALDNGKEVVFEGEVILASFGRIPNLEGLEKLNLKVDRKGVVTTDSLETNQADTYAIGDVNGKYMLAHVASAEGIAAVENIMGENSKIDYNKIPSCIYSFPEVGVVGLTEQDAREQGYDVIISKFPLSVNGKALAEGESMGFVKIVADRTYGEVIGVHIIASHATDMIAEAVASMALEGTIHDLSKTVHPHPTLSEVVMEAAHGAVDQPIHMIRHK